MATVTPRATTPDDALVELADRFDRGPIDLPGGRGRVRLEVVDGASCDAVISGARSKRSANSTRASSGVVARGVTVAIE